MKSIVHFMPREHVHFYAYGTCEPDFPSKAMWQWTPFQNFSGDKKRISQDLGPVVNTFSNAEQEEEKEEEVATAATEETTLLRVPYLCYHGLL